MFLALALGNQGTCSQAGSWSKILQTILYQARGGKEVAGFMWDYIGGEKKSKLHSYLFYNIIQNFPQNFVLFSTNFKAFIAY